MARSKVVKGLIVALVAAVFSTQGCSKQGEGERCELANAGPTEDCDDGLICVSSTELTDPSTDRCCPPEGEGFSDSRCARGGVIPDFDAGADASTGGTGGTGGTDAGGTGGTDTGGTGGTDAGGSDGTGEAGAGGA